MRPPEPDPLSGNLNPGSLFKRRTGFGLTLAVILTAVALAGQILLTQKSENHFLLGLSFSRMMIVLLLAAAVLMQILFLIRINRLPAGLFMSQLKNIFGKTSLVRLFVLLPAAGFFISAAICLLALTDIGAFHSLIPSLFERGGPFFIWILTISVLILLWIRLAIRAAGFSLNALFPDWFRMLLFSLAALAAALAFSYYDRQDWTRSLPHAVVTILLPALIAGLGLTGRGLIRLEAAQEKWLKLFRALLIGAAVFTIIRLTCFAMYRTTTAPKSYWDLLADAFLHGKLFLENPPSNHDLTLHGGKWYVPNPPLPAVVLMPYIALFGLEAVNMTVFSALLGAVNTMLVFLMLEKAASIGMIRSGRMTNLWITIVFAFAGSHFWLATTGQMWFVSQLCALSFCVLACLSVLKNQSLFVSGILLGAAMLARPNVFPLALLLIGIRLWQENRTEGTFRDRFRTVLRFGLQLALPMGICAFGLLWYNYVRFGDWLDFGYVTINGAPWILEAVQRYGMFHPHFFRTNLNVMLLKLPQFDFSGARYFFQPGISGYSIFAMTPPLFYLFKPAKMTLWRIGAWTSLLLTLLMLLFYHNTGAEQIGYRYLLDAMTPVLLILADNASARTGTFFKILTILGILISWFSISWWYLGRV